MAQARQFFLTYKKPVYTEPKKLGRASAESCMSCIMRVRSLVCSYKKIPAQKLGFYYYVFLDFLVRVNFFANFSKYSKSPPQILSSCSKRCSL